MAQHYVFSEIVNEEFAALSGSGNHHSLCPSIPCGQEVDTILVDVQWLGKSLPNCRRTLRWYLILRSQYAAPDPSLVIPESFSV